MVLNVQVDLEDPMTDFEKTLWEKLDRRTARLRRLVEIHAPVSVLTHEVILIENALTVLDPEVYGSVRAVAQSALIRPTMGLCQMMDCDQYTDPDGGICGKCNDKIDREFGP